MNRKVVIFVIGYLLILIGCIVWSRAAIIEVPEAEGRMNLMIVGGGAGGATTSVPACSTSKDSETGTTGTQVTLGNSSSYYYLATEFTEGQGGYTVCKADAYLNEIGSGTVDFNIRLCIYDDDGGSPNYPNSVVDCSDYISGDFNQESETAITFSDNLSATLTSGNVYWVVLQASAVDATDYVEWNCGTYIGSDQTVRSSDGSTWNSTNNRRGKFVLYSQ